MVTRPFVLITTATLAMFIYIGAMTPLLPRLIEEHLGGNEFDIVIVSRPYVAAMHIPAIRQFAPAFHPGLTCQRKKQRHGFLGDQILGVVQQQVIQTQRETREACGILGKQAPHGKLRARRMMGKQSLPGL